MSFIILIILIILLVLYFVPSIVGYSRNHKQTTPILLLNIFLGWTALGWVAALVWASMKQD